MTFNTLKRLLELTNQVKNIPFYSALRYPINTTLFKDDILKTIHRSMNLTSNTFTKKIHFISKYEYALILRQTKHTCIETISNHASKKYALYSTTETFSNFSAQFHE